MKKRNAWSGMVLLAIASLFFACETPEEESTDQEVRDLPYFGNHDIALVKQDDGSALSTEQYFTVPPFAFTNQSGREVSHRDYEGHIYVVDFFFTTCPTICPVMSSQLSRLQELLKKESLFGEVKLLSHTVDPENDTPEVLRAYAEKLDADTNHWHFVTGDQIDLYDQAKYGYFMTALESDTAAGGFFHSDTFVLIDANKHIRGYYDGTSTSEVDQLFFDINYLSTQK